MRSNKEKINSQRLLLAILATALTVTLYFVFHEGPFLNSIKDLFLQILPNLIAVLAAFLIVDAFLNSKGIGPYQFLKDEIIGLVGDKVKSGSIIDASKANADFDLKGKLQKAKTIDIIGYSCLNIIRAFRGDFVEAMKNGTKIRLISVEGESIASSLIMERSRLKVLENDLLTTAEFVDIIETEISKVNKKRKGAISHRKINWIPSCSMVIYNKDLHDGEARVFFNHPNLRTPVSSISINHLISRHTEPRYFAYIVDQFESLWSSTGE